MRCVPGKRGFDCMIAGAALVALSPLLVVAAVAIRLVDGPPVFFRQERIGRRGRPFRIWKFRTMRTASKDRSGQITVGEDPRITSIGARLRRTKVDELPQLLNVLCGDMSMVGYRPDVARYVDAEDEVQRRVLVRRPGMTDPASIRYRDENGLLALAVDPAVAYRRRILPDKLRLSLRFAERESLSADWRVLWTTLRPERGG